MKACVLSALALAGQLLPGLVAKEAPAWEAVDNCPNGDNWGIPDPQAKRPFSPNEYENVIRPFCDGQNKWQTHPFSDYPDAMVTYYKNNEDYSQFIATDMVPESFRLWKSSAPWGKKYDHTSIEPFSMKISECFVDTGDEGGWTIQRIGPFKSVGGYDWWQLGWDDVWGIKSLLQKHPDGIYITAQLSSPVTADGERLGHPPIHVHHVHVTPTPGVRQRSDPWRCMLENKDCFDPTRVGEHHGDYECRPEDGGFDCFTETFPQGYGKLVTMPLGLESDFNDVRAPGSPVFEWYYELGMRWVPKTSDAGKQLRPMSFHNFAGPGDYILSDQMTFIFTYQCPTDHESIFWYTGRMKRSAKMLRLKLHAHNTIFSGALFVSASPEQLGLTTGNQLVPEKPYLTVDTKKAGFANNDDLKKFLLKNLAQSQNEAKQQGAKVPKTVCETFADYTEVEGYVYDRRPPTCCQDWDIEAEEVFTVVGFNDHIGVLPGPHSTSIPATLPGHIGWWLSYDTREDPPASHYSIIMYNQNKDGQLENLLDISPRQKLSVAFNRGTVHDFNPHNIPYRSLATISLGVIYLVGTWWGRLLSVSMVSVGLGLYMYSRSRRQKQAKIGVQINVPSMPQKRTDVEKTCPEAVADSIAAVPQAVVETVKKAKDEMERQQRAATKAD